ARGNAIGRCKRDQLDAPAREERVASDVQGLRVVAHESGEGCLDLAPGAGLEDLNLQPHCAGCFRYVAKRALGGRDIGWIDQHGNANGPGDQLVQKCQPLRSQLSHEKIDPRQISARAGEAVDKTELDRVFADTKDDRDGRGGSFGHLSSVIASRRGDNGHATTHEVSDERRKAIELALQPVVLHRYVLALAVAPFVQALAERGGERRIGRSGVHKSDHWHRGLLRARSERPSGRRAAEQRDEIAPPNHSITSSARTSSDGGTSRPSALAVLRLRTVSYLVGACTGRSAGFSPRRIRST